MRFIPFDQSTWARKSHFELYMRHAKCTFNLAAKLDITVLHAFVKQQGLRLYPVCIAAIAAIANTIPEFKTHVDAQGRAGYWEHVGVSYPLFHKDSCSFTMLHSVHKPEFQAQYATIITDMERYKNHRGVFACDTPPNNLNLSCLPWIHFTGFTLQLFNDSYLSPIITWGKYAIEGGRMHMPISIQAHHAAMDGYHAASFLNRLQALALNPETLVPAHNEVPQ